MEYADLDGKFLWSLTDLKEQSSKIKVLGCVYIARTREFIT